MSLCTFTRTAPFAPPALLVALAINLAYATPARADAPQRETAPSESSTTDTPPGTSTPAPAERRAAWSVDAGVRTSFVRGSGYDPYSTDDALRQFSLGGSRTVFRVGRLSLAPGLRWDVGGSSASARGARASLLVHRVAIAVEGRVDIAPYVYGFVRATPGIAFARMRINDASSTSPLEASHALFSADLSVGAMLSFPVAKSAARIGVAPELGYGVVTKASAGLTPAADDGAPRRTGSTSLEGLALSGAFFRVSAVAEF